MDEGEKTPSAGTKPSLTLPMPVARTKSAPVLLPLPSRRDAVRMGAASGPARCEPTTPMSCRAATSRAADFDFTNVSFEGGAATEKHDKRPRTGCATPGSAFVKARRNKRSVTFGEAQLHEFRVVPDLDGAESD